MVINVKTASVRYKIFLQIIPSELAFESSNIKMEIPAEANYKSVGKKNSRLPLKKRFFPLINYNPDNKEQKMNSHLQEHKISFDCKQSKLETRDVGVQVKLDTFNASSTAASVNEVDSSDHIDWSVAEELQEAICETVRKWRRANEGAATVPSAIIAGILKVALCTAAWNELNKVDQNERNSVIVHCTSTLAVTDTSSSRDKENMNAHHEDPESDSDDNISMQYFLRKKMKPGMVPIGYGFAYVPASLLSHIDWKSYTTATKKLLLGVFPRSILATHSLTGKRSQAFPNLPPKNKLPIRMVNDIIQTVVKRCGVSANLVRTVITTKCADESKKKAHKK